MLAMAMSMLLALSPTEAALEKVAVDRTTFRSAEDYEIAMKRDEVLYLYSAFLHTKLSGEEWMGIKRFIDDHPDCDLACVVLLARQSMEE